MDVSPCPCRGSLSLSLSLSLSGAGGVPLRPVAHNFSLPQQHLEPEPAAGHRSQDREEIWLFQPPHPHHPKVGQNEEEGESEKTEEGATAGTPEHAPGRSGRHRKGCLRKYRGRPVPV